MRKGNEETLIDHQYLKNTIYATFLIYIFQIGTLLTFVLCHTGNT